MFILNILENGVEGKKIEYKKNIPNDIKKIYFLNNIVAEKSFKKNERLNYLKKLICEGLTFYIITEKDAQNISKHQWKELFNSLDNKNKKILKNILHVGQNNKYTRSRYNIFVKLNKKNKTKKIKLKR
jgi:hypothetical protein